MPANDSNPPPPPPAHRNPSADPAEGEAWLDAQLREGLDDYVDDAGFTARVLAALPASPAPASRPWLRPLLIGAGAVVGLLVTAVLAQASPGLGVGPKGVLRATFEAVTTALSSGGSDSLPNPAQVTLLSVCGLLVLGSVVQAWRRIRHSRGH